MTQIKFIIISALTFLVLSCSNRQGPEIFSDDRPATLSVNSLLDLEGLKKKIIQSTKPLFSEIDTIVLDDYMPLYCGHATAQERALNYFPILSDSAGFSNLYTSLGKRVFYASKINGYLGGHINETVQIHIDGEIISGREIIIAENYTHNNSYCYVKKLFTYSNNSWTFVVKENRCSTPTEKRRRNTGP